MVDGTNTVVWEGEFEPFGRARVNIHSSVVNNNRFPGQYYDQETGFHYNYHMYYDPQTGRYLTPDPIGLAGGMNLYAYVGNDPVNAVDASGLYSLNPIARGERLKNAPLPICPSGLPNWLKTFALCSEEEPLLSAWKKVLRWCDPVPMAM